MVYVLHARGVLVAFAAALSLSELVLSVDTSDGWHSDEVASESPVGGVSESCANDCIWTTGLQHDDFFGNTQVGSDANRAAVWWSAQTDVHGGVRCTWKGVLVRDGQSLLMSDLLSWLKSRDIDVPWRCQFGPEEPYGHSIDLSQRLSTNDVIGLSFDVRRAVSVVLDKAALTKGKRAKDYASSDSSQCTANSALINDGRERQRLLEEELRELTSRLEETQMLYENALKSLAKLLNQGGMYQPGSTLEMNTDDMDDLPERFQPASLSTAECHTGSDHGDCEALDTQQPHDVLRIIDSHDADVNAVDRARPEPVTRSPSQKVRDGVTILSFCAVELPRWIFAALRVHVFEHVAHASRSFVPHDLSAQLVLSFEKLIKGMDSIIGVQVLFTREKIETMAYVTLVILSFAFMLLLRWTVRLLRIRSKSKSRSGTRAEDTVNKPFRSRPHERHAEGRPEHITSATSEVVNTTRKSQFGSEVDRNMKAQQWREMNSTTGAEVEWKNFSVPSPVGEQGQVEEQLTGMSSQVVSTALKHEATLVPQMRRGPPPRVNTNLMNLNPAYESIASWESN